VCYFWPTMLGVTSERVPKSGALGLALMGGMGMLIVGVVTTPQMGRVADQYLHEQLQSAKAQETVTALGHAAESYPALAADEDETIRTEILSAVGKAQEVLDETTATGLLPEGKTADALRSTIANSPKDGMAQAIKGELEDVLNPADNYGGRMSFRYVAPFSIVIIIVFGIIYLRDRAGGGYQAEKLTAGEMETPRDANS
jgi:hypothetical protein